MATSKIFCSSTDGKLNMCTFAFWKSWFTQIQVRSLLLLQTTFPEDIQNNFCHVSRIVTEFSASDHTTFLWVQQWHYCAQKTVLNNESTHALCINTLHVNIQKCSIKTQRYKRTLLYCKLIFRVLRNFASRVLGLFSRLLMQSFLTRVKGSPKNIWEGS